MVGCSDDPKLPLGGSCERDDECVSGICGESVCLDPAQDTDGDGLINSLEKAFGSDPTKADSDADGIDDPDEIASDLSAVDTDGDGALDILESSTADQDDDCIPDQYDAEDAVPNGDLSPLIKVVCADSGPCREQRAVLSVSCATGAATCVYDRVEGFADPEVTCDGVDENCDGTTDEGFPAGCVDDDWDDDGVADALDVCPEVADAAQADGDGDGIGDACVDLYELVFVAPLPPTTIVATATFDVHAVVRRKATDDERPAAPTFKGDVELTSLPDETLIDTVTASGAIDFGDVALTSAGTWTLQLSTTIGVATSEPITVSAGPAASIVLIAPATSVAGEAFDLSAEALDAFGNLADLDGAATLSSDDDLAAILDETPFVDGRWALSGVVLREAGTTSLQLMASGISGSAEIDVTPGPAAALAIGLADNVKAGVATPVRVSAIDASGNMTTLDGVAALSSDDPRVTVRGQPIGPSPTVANVTLSAGTGTVDVVFGTVGEHTLSATLGAIEGSDTTIVRAGSPAGIALVAPDAVAATPSTIEVHIVDAYGQVADDPNDTYTGTVSFDLSGPAPARAPTLPGATTFGAADAGRRVVSATWFSAGTWTLRATGTNLEANVATAVVDVIAGALGAFEVTLPATSRAGIAVDLTITAVDLGGNRVTGFVGDVGLAVDDARSDLPGSLVFTSGNQGRRTLPVRFGTIGLRTVTVVADALTADASTTVTAGAPEAIVLSQTGPATTGIPHAVHVAIVDAFGNVANAEGDSFIGNVSFTALPAPDVVPTLPVPTAFTASDLSERDITTTWFTAGQWQLRASATGLTAGLLAVEVAPGVATSLEVLVPTTAKAGVAVDVTVRALDPAGNVDPTFGGTVTLSDGDPVSDLPASIELTAGTHTLPVVFGTVGVQTISASAGPLSDSTATTVRAGVPHQLVLTTTGTIEVGVAKGVHVAAVDRFGNVANDPATLYLGTVTFDVTPTPTVAPTLPAATSFVAANRSERDVSTTWRSPGSFTLRATGTNLAVTVATLPVVVTGSATTQLEVVLPATTTANTAVALTVTARDAAGNVDPAFTGTVVLVDDDDESDLPASIDFVAANAGTRTLQVTFKTPGLRTVTASQGPLTGSDAIDVQSTTTALRITAPASMVAGSAPTGTLEAVNAQGALDPSFSGVATLSGAPGLPASVTLTNGTATLPLPLTTAGTFTIVATSGAVTGQRVIGVTHAAPAAIVASSSADYFATGQPFPVTAEIIDAYGNTATSFVGDVVVQPNDGSSGGVISITAAHLGQGTTDITIGSTGLWTVQFSTTSPALSTSLEVTVYSDDPSRVVVTLPSAPFYVGEPLGTVQVSVTDGDGAPAVSSSDIVVDLRLGVSHPHAARLVGSQVVLAPGEHSVSISDLAVSKAGVFSIEATSSGLDPGETETFEVYHRPPTVTVTHTTINDGCVTIDYDIDQPTGRTIDVVVDQALSDAFEPASAAPTDNTVDGTRGLSAGSHTYVWNAPRDLPYKFNGTRKISVRARVADAFEHPYVASDALETFVDLRQAWSIDTHEAGDADARNGIAVGDIDGDGREDVVYTTDARMQIAYGDGDSDGFNTADGAFGEVAMADFDHDGESEVAAIVGATVQIFRGGSAIASWQPAACDGEAAIDVAFGDFDGRDTRDLAVLCPAEGPHFTLELWRFKSGWQRYDEATGNGLPRTLAVTDLSYDGIDDLIVGTSLGFTTIVGRDTSPDILHDLLVDTAIGEVTSIAATDLSYDGYSDAIVIADGVALRYDNSQDPLDPLYFSSDVAVDAPREVAIANPDRDGYPELVFSTDTGLFIRSLDGTPGDVPTSERFDRLASGASVVALGVGTTTAFATLVAAPPPICRPRAHTLQAAPPWLDRDALVADDFDQDGKVDLAGGGLLAFGRGDGSFAPETVDFPNGHVTTGDFDGDPYRDFITSDDDSGQFTIWLRDLEPLPIGWSNIQNHDSQVGWNPVDVADVDGDGMDDVVHAYGDGAIVIGYQSATTAISGALDNMMWSTGPVRDLVVANVDGRYGLDIVYYKVEEPTPGDLHHALCTMLSVDPVHRGYGGPSCTPLDEGLSQADRAAFSIRGLAVDVQDGTGTAFYIAEVEGYTGNLQARRVGGLPAPGDANYVDVCNGGGPRSFALGEIDTDPSFVDVLVACDVDGNSYMSTLAGGIDGYEDSIDAVFGGAALTVADFDGDGLNEIGGTDGTIDFGYGDGLLESLPDYFGFGLVQGTDATASGDFDGWGGGQLAVVTIYDDGDTYLEVRVESPTYGGTATYNERVCSDCELGRSWNVQTAVGDLDDDGRDDLAVLYGAEGEPSQLLLLKRDVNGDLVTIAAPNLGMIGAEIAVAKVLGGVRNDIVVAGISGGLPRLVVVHHEGSGYYVLDVDEGTFLPSEIDAMAAADIHAEYPGAEVVLAAGTTLHVYATVDCGDFSCLGHVVDVEASPPGSNVHTVQLAGGRGPGTQPLVVLSHIVSEGSSWFELRRFDWDAASEVFDMELLARRSYDAYPCSFGYPDCVKPAFGPYVRDFDRDGADDVIVGWREGQTWEVFGDGERYLAAASTRAAQFAELLDNNGLPGFALFDYLPQHVWLIRR